MRGFYFSRGKLFSHSTTFIMLASFILFLALWLQQGWAQTSCPAVTQHLTDPPYDNYFYSDCHGDSQAVVTSPLPDSNLTLIGPRFIVAWPAGNSGICNYFQPLNGPNGSLAIELVNSTVGSPLGPIYRTAQGSANPFVGVQGVLSFNSSAELTIPILGSIRTIRDFTEGPSLLRPVIQDAIKITKSNGTGATISRLCEYSENAAVPMGAFLQSSNADLRQGSTMSPRRASQWCHTRNRLPT
jgi:hypothetical protein